MSLVQFSNGIRGTSPQITLIHIDIAQLLYYYVVVTYSTYTTTYTINLITTEECGYHFERHE